MRRRSTKPSSKPSRAALARRAVRAAFPDDPIPSPSRPPPPSTQPPPLQLHLGNPRTHLYRRHHSSSTDASSTPSSPDLHHHHPQPHPSTYRVEHPQHDQHHDEDDDDQDDDQHHDDDDDDDDDDQRDPYRYLHRSASQPSSTDQSLGKRWSFHNSSTSPRLDDLASDIFQSPHRQRHRRRRHRDRTDAEHSHTAPLSKLSHLPLVPDDVSSAATSMRAADGKILVQVRRWVLEGNGTALRKEGRLSQIRKKAIGYKTVVVEANPEGLAHTCLYASDQMLHSPFIEPYKPTEPITSRSDYVDRASVVYRHRPFEIGVVGMSVGSHSFKHHPGHILMYSLQRDPADHADHSDAFPIIHYHPSTDATASAPDQFIPVPASTSLFLASDANETDFETRQSVNCRFKILQLDNLQKSVQSSVASVEQLSNHVAQFTKSAPLLGILSPALSLASVLSRRSLDSHAKPDRMVKIDMNFMLAEQTRNGQNDLPSTSHFERCSGEYLRYGYYFFLDKRVDAKLYASFRTFPNVQLMMKRTEVDTMAPNERKYFPLTGVTYLVIRVTPRLTGSTNTRRPIRMSHVQRLSELMKTCVDDEGRDAEKTVQSLADLARELGISKGREARRPASRL